MTIRQSNEKDRGKRQRRLGQAKVEIEDTTTNVRQQTHKHTHTHSSIRFVQMLVLFTIYCVYSYCKGSVRTPRGIGWLFWDCV